MRRKYPFYVYGFDPFEWNFFIGDKVRNFWILMRQFGECVKG